MASYDETPEGRKSRQLDPGRSYLTEGRTEAQEQYPHADHTEEDRGWTLLHAINNATEIMDGLEHTLQRLSERLRPISRDEPNTIRISGSVGSDNEAKPDVDTRSLLMIRIGQLERRIGYATNFIADIDRKIEL